MKFTVLVSVCLLVVTTAASTAVAATSWRLAAAYNDANSHTQIDRWLAKQIEQGTDGALTVRVYSNGSLVKHPQIEQAVATGQVQMGDLLGSILSNQSPIFAIDSIPFLATDYPQARALWQAQKPFVKDILDERGIKLLYASPWPPQGLYTNKKIASVDDMQGVKFRSYNAQTAQLARLMGATPTQVEAPQIPQAFATGMVEAMAASPATGRNTQAWDYAKYYYDVEAWIPKNLVVVNQRAFQALPKAQQKVVTQAAEKAKQRSWSEVKKVYERDLEELKSHGLKILKPSDKLKNQFREIGKQMVADWENKAGQKGDELIANYRDTGE